MPNRGIVANPVATIKPKLDPGQATEETGPTDEYDPTGEGGGDVMDIDKSLKETGEAPHASNGDLIIEDVDHPLKHAVVKNRQEEEPSADDGNL